MTKIKAVLIALALGLSASAQAGQSFLVISGGNSVSAKMEKEIAAAGGVISNRGLSRVGVLVVESDNPDFAARISSAAAVPNIKVRMIPPQDQGIEMDAANPPTSGDDDFFFDLQWGHDAVNAPEAWEAGVRGEGAVVAVLDGGFDLDHPDLVSQIIEAVDFTGEGPQYGLPDPFSHGTHVAGTIAAADNAFGTIGVAPDARLVLVKVLGDEGSGSFEDVISGILYAASRGDVDVINMSLGADIPQGLGIGSNEIAALRVAMNRAVDFAYQQGITVVVAAGNDGRDLDKDKSMVVFPADMPNALSISATGPFVWAADPTGSLDNQAIYTNFGRSRIDFAAPGGDYTSLFFPEGQALCTVAGLTRPCYVFDFVFSTGNNSWYWSVGTSMASPHAAGIAALIIGENGGTMHPAQVRAEMQRRAADLGQPGKDPVYGAGRVSSGY